VVHSDSFMHGLLRAMNLQLVSGVVEW
jgi:hypothetical protein